jgi:hypothetical protein
VHLPPLVKFGSPLVSVALGLVDLSLSVLVQLLINPPTEAAWCLPVALVAKPVDLRMSLLLRTR